MAKLYPEFTLISDSEKLYSDLRLSQVVKVNGFGDAYKAMFKKICNMVRESAGIDRIVGFGVVEETKEIIVYVYAIIANEDSFYDQKVDEDNNVYLEV